MNRLTKSSVLYFIAITFILFLGLFLRINHYSQVPFPGESRDEYSFTWLGLSLIQTGLPAATSGISAYTHEYLYINVDNIFNNFQNPNPFPIDRFWFDHPPLFSLIPGVFSYSLGVKTFADTAVYIIRKPMIILGMVNLLLLIGYAGIIFGRRVSLITGLLYATEPLVVISSRTVQAENFLITGFLLTLLSLYFYFKTKRGELFWLTVSLCGLFTLVKLSAVSLMLTVIVLILIFDRYRPFLKSFLTLLGTILIWLFFPVLGLIYDFNLFIKVLRFNSGRFMRDGLNVVYALFTHQNITRDFSSGFVPLGLIATASLASEASTKKNYYWVVTPMLTYLLVYIIFGSEGYGWYKYPLFPWLFLSIAIIMDRSMEKFNSLFILLLTFIPGGIMINRFINAEQLMPYLWLFRIFTILMFTLTFTPLIFSGNKHIRLFQTIFITSILLFLVSLNIFTNLAITPDAWYNFNFLKSI